MDDELILLVAIVGLLVALAALVVGVASYVRLRGRLRRAEAERAGLAQRLRALESSRTLTSRAENEISAPPPADARKQAPAPPAEDDYAAAEAELRALDSGDWGAETAGTGTVAEAAARSAASSAARPTSEDVAAPRRPAGAANDPSTGGARRPAAFSLEDFLGGRVLLVVGVVVVLFALGFFLKFAIERDLVAPRVRVLVGVAGGLAALVGGDVIRRRGFDLFGHAVMGGGLGALFLSCFFAAARYELIPRPVAFCITGVVALAGIVVAVRREAPLLAYLGLLGGYIAPAILGEGTDALEGLTGWLLALHGAVLFVLWLRRWPGLDLLALLSSSTYFALWADLHLTEERLSAAAWCLVALTAVVLAIALAPGILRRRPLGPTALLTAILTGCIAFTAGYELFERDHPYAVGAATVALGVVYAVAARRAVGRARDRDLDRPVLDGCAVAAAAAAIPMFLEGAALAPAWAAAGVVAVLLAATSHSAPVAAGGLIMVALAQLDLLSNRMPMHDGAFTPFANGAFLSWASPSLAAVLSGLVLRWRSPWRLFSGIVLGAGAWLYAPVLVAEVAMHFLEDRATYGAGYEELALSGGVIALAGYALVLAIVVRRRSPVAILLPLGPLVAVTLFSLPVVLFVDRPGYVPVANFEFLAGVVVVAAWWASTLAARGMLRVILLVGSVAAGLMVVGGECAAYGENAAVVGTSREALERVGQVWMSVSFSVYAAALLGLGFARRLPALRWSGLAIFLVTLGKVFFVDMAELPTAHRIGGFLVLGVLLLGASFLYQRARRES